MIDGMDDEIYDGMGDFEWDEWEAGCDAAYDPTTSAEKLDELARGCDVIQRGLSWLRGVASNRSTQVSTLMYLAVEEDWMVRAFISRNPNATPAVLMKLVVGGDLDVLESVIQHPNATLEVFAAIADPATPDPHRREMVAECERTPVEILMQLAEDEGVGVRMGVISNPSTPPRVKLYLQSGYNQSMTLKEFLEAVQ